MKNFIKNSIFLCIVLFNSLFSYTLFAQEYLTDFGGKCLIETKTNINQVTSNITTKDTEYFSALN